MITVRHLKIRLKLTCPHCRAKLATSHVFCPECGLKVEKAIAQSKEKRRVRTLPLDGDTIKMIRDYINQSGPVTQSGKLLLFGISRNHAWRVVRECARRAGLGLTL
jgi:integrase/recombinase XerD